MGPEATLGKSRAHRSAIGELIAIWGALPRTLRRFVSDLAAVFLHEGSRIPGRVAWAAVSFVVAGALVVTGWLLLCGAAAVWVTSIYGWQLQAALGLIAGLNVLVAIIAAVAAYHWVKSPYFPVTSYELHRLREFDSSRPPEQMAHTGERVPEADAKEQALMRSEAELQAQIALVRRATPHLLTRPQVIASTAAIGMVLGLITSRRKPQAYARETGKGSTTRQLLNVAVGQLSSLAMAAALREFERRRDHGRPRF